MKQCDLFHMVRQLFGRGNDLAMIYPYPLRIANEIHVNSYCQIYCNFQNSPTVLCADKNPQCC